MNKVYIVISGGNLFIGKLFKTHDVWQIENPRGLIPMQGSRPGQVNLTMSNVLGDPKLIYLEGSMVYFVPEDQTLINEYIKSTTGIQVASSIVDFKRPN